MTVRVYLQAARLVEGDAQPGDLPAERIFIDAAEVPEFWVETESAIVPAVGRTVAFSMPGPIELGVTRILGTVERRVNKHTKERLGDDETAHPL